MSDSAPTAPQIVPAEAIRPSSAPPRRLGFAVWVVVLTTALFVWLVWFAEPNLERLLSVFLTPTVGGLFLLCWWLFRSGYSWRTKLMPLLLAAAGGALAILFAQRFTQPFAILWGIPASAGAAVLYAAIARSGNRNRKLSGALATLIATITFLPWFALQTAGQQGEGMVSFGPRWGRASATALQGRGIRTSGSTSAPASFGALTNEDWPGFRGLHRDSVYRGGTKLNPAAFAKPKELWRKPVGSGWSSFAVVGDHVWTQEQQGENECVTCFDLRDGNVIWSYCFPNRFDEMAGGPGPRSTPTFANGRIYAMGPSAHLFCLDAATGKPIWKYDDYAKQMKPPMWGFACSPLLWGGYVIVGLCGAGGIRLAAHHGDTGTQLWTVPGGADGYSSPHFAQLGGVDRILYFDGAGCVGVTPPDGKVRWDFQWPANQPRAAQPCVVDDKSLIIGMGYGIGLKRLEIMGPGFEGGLEAREVWSSNKLKPKFNDFVRHEDHLYGLDDNILTCVSVADGSRAWKGGRYGFGQVLLVPPHLVVASEEGEIALVEASPREYKELARFKAIEGKTWNHPVLTGTRLLVRNGEEAACFDVGAGGEAATSRPHE